MTIPSPYNFVPLSRYVYFPEWSDKVSMDVPFSDGICGSIAVKVKAKTPIYIGNGKEDREFFRLYKDGPYAIPGTSFKGMLRNVVEIISFSKIAGSSGSTARVANHRYALRDLTKGADVYRSKMTGQKSGWLNINENNEWTITPCSFAFVEQKAIEDHYGLNDMALGKRGSAEEKYDKLRGKSLEVDFDYYNKARKNERATLGEGKFHGTIVMTGQPSDRTNRGAKHLEFIFFAEKGESDRITVPDDKKEDFIFIHSTLGENRKPNREWGFWKKRGGPIPVFYKTVVGNDKQLESFGLAYMYRLAYEKNIFEAIANTSPQHCGGPDGKPDFAETLFGRAEKNDSLRGRVNVEPLIAVSTPESSASVKTVLGTPRPTYYPNYIKQEPSKQKPSKVDKTKFERYKTFMDPKCEIRGWKRYISRKEALSEDKLPQAAVKDGGGDNVSTTFTPLPAETVFTGKIHFHNVKPEELGAIVWALTWGDRNGLRHSLGMAKPYGFGGITVTIDKTQTHLRMCGSDTVPPLKDCMAAFVENTMNPWLKGIYKPKGENAKTLGETKEVKLEETDEVKALLAMADPNLEWDQLDGRTVYPEIGKDNSFVSYKNNMEFLTFDPQKPKKAAPPKATAAPPVKKADLTPAMKYAEELNKSKKPKLFFKDLSEMMKRFGASPESATPEEKKEVFEAIRQRLDKNRDPRTKGFWDKWKP